MYCFLIRRTISGALDAGRKTPAFAEKHLAHCAACRRFREEAGELHRNMASPQPVETEIPPFLHARIMAGVKEERNRSANTPAFLSGKVLRPAVAVAVGLAAFLLLKPDHGSDEVELLGTLDRGREQVAALVVQGPDRLFEPLNTELAMLQQDLTNSTKHLESILDSDIFSMLATR